MLYSRMGNTSKKLAAKCSLLTREEQKFIANTFRAASKNSDKIREEDLIVSGRLDAELLEVCWFESHFLVFTDGVKGSLNPVVFQEIIK